MHAPWPVIDPPGVHFADEEDDVLLDDAETADDDEEACCEWLRQRLQPEGESTVLRGRVWRAAHGGWRHDDWELEDLQLDQSTLCLYGPAAASSVVATAAAGSAAGSAQEVTLVVACENIVDVRRPKQPRPGHRSGFHVIYDVFQAPGAAPQRFKLTLEVVEQSEDEEEQQDGPGGSAVESGVPWRGVLREYAAAARSRSTGAAQPPRFSSWAPLPAAPEPEPEPEPELSLACPPPPVSSGCDAVDGLDAPSLLAARATITGAESESDDSGGDDGDAHSIQPPPSSGSEQSSSSSSCSPADLLASLRASATSIDQRRQVLDEITALSTSTPGQKRATTGNHSLHDAITSLLLS